MAKKRVKKVTATVILFIDEKHVCEDHSIEEDLTNEFVKVKSGVYENLASGWIEKVQAVEDEVEETVEEAVKRYIERQVQRHPAIQNWFTPPPGKKPYTIGTKQLYLEYLEDWCHLTGMTPEELAACEDIDRMRGLIAAGVRARGVMVITVRFRINALNVFWRRNERRVKDVHGGIPKHLRADIERLQKWKPGVEDDS